MIKKKNQILIKSSSKINIFNKDNSQNKILTKYLFLQGQAVYKGMSLLTSSAAAPRIVLELFMGCPGADTMNLHFKVMIIDYTRFSIKDCIDNAKLNLQTVKLL